MPKDQDEKRVSLSPLKPVDALKALLAVDPDSEPAEEKDRSERREPDREERGRRPGRGVSER